MLLYKYVRKKMWKAVTERDLTQFRVGQQDKSKRLNEIRRTVSDRHILMCA